MTLPSAPGVEKRDSSHAPSTAKLAFVSSSDDFERRRAARQSWPVAVFPLGQEPGDDLSATTTAAERIAMMWPLAREAWAVAGRPLPTYTRKEVPGRLFRPGETPASDDD